MALCVAGLVGQMTAFGQTTNAVYTVDSVISYKVGKDSGSISGSATAYFLSDGTCDLATDKGYHLTGTYKVSKNDKTVTLTPDANGKAAIESEIASYIETQFPGATATVTSFRWSKITVNNGTPVNATITGGGKGCETVGTKTKCKSFTFKTTVTNWTCQGTCTGL
jgi:hypothetical protein